MTICCYSLLSQMLQNSFWRPWGFWTQLRRQPIRSFSNDLLGNRALQMFAETANSQLQHRFIANVCFPMVCGDSEFAVFARIYSKVLLCNALRKQLIRSSSMDWQQLIASQQFAEPPNSKFQQTFIAVPCFAGRTLTANQLDAVDQMLNDFLTKRKNGSARVPRGALSQFARRT